MTQTMLEKLTTVIGESLYGYVDPVDTTNTWATSKAVARAALQALREPTEEVVKAISANIDAPGFEATANKEAQALISDLIDAILQEKPEPL